jgi:hypothetical protein
VPTVRAGGVLLKVYLQDHGPRIHVHGFYDEIEVIIDLRPDRTVGESRRRDAIKGHAKLSDVRKILNAAAEKFDELVAKWKEVHR